VPCRAVAVVERSEPAVRTRRSPARSGAGTARSAGISGARQARYYEDLTLGDLERDIEDRRAHSQAAKVIRFGSLFGPAERFRRPAAEDFGDSLQAQSRHIVLPVRPHGRTGSQPTATWRQPQPLLPMTRLYAPGANVTDITFPDGQPDLRLKRPARLSRDKDETPYCVRDHIPSGSRRKSAVRSRPSLWGRRVRASLAGRRSGLGLMKSPPVLWTPDRLSQKGFSVLPRRWTVERTLAWLTDR
jgi:hypothetical protein